MENCSPAKTVLPSGFSINRHEIINYKHDEDSEKYPYRKLVGALLFLSNTTRPDISFPVSLLSRYMDRPTKHLWNAAKNILRYLNGTMSYGITFQSTEKSSMLHGFSDASFATDIIDRRSTSGYIFKMCGGAICWRSKKQYTTAQSTVEAEYVALSFAVREGLWLQQLMTDTGIVKPQNGLKIFCDNQGTISLSNNEYQNERTKHIDVKLNFVKENVGNKNISLSYISTHAVTADLLTKLLPPGKQNIHARNMGIKSFEK